ncbi:MAG: WD40 repeat domain-containing protein [bacterium]|nr:WD40 repeat domain-containing protein [bacterium]
MNASKKDDQMNSKAFDPTKTHVVAEFKYRQPLTTLRSDSTGRFIAAGAQDLDVQLWHVQTEKSQTLKGHDSWVRSIDFTPDGNRLLTACWGGVVKIWDIEPTEAKEILSIQAHQGATRFVRVSPDGKQFATCGNDLMVRVWNLSDGKLLHEFAGHERHVYGVMFEPNGEHLVSQDLVGGVKIWSIATGKEERTIHAKMMTGYDKKFAADMGGSRDLDFHPDGAEWASAGITNLTNGFAGAQEPIIVVFDWKTDEVVRDLRATNGFKGIAWGVRFLDDQFIVGAGAQQNGKGEIWFYNQENDKPFHTVKLPKAIRGIDLLGDNRLAAAHADGFVRIYSMTAEEKDQS